MVVSTLTCLSLATAGGTAVTLGPFFCSGRPHSTPAYGIDKLGLTKNDGLHGLDRTPRFQAPRSVAVPEYRHVVCQVDGPEASEWDWMVGYYLLEISPKEVAKRLGPTGVG